MLWYQQLYLRNRKDFNVLGMLIFENFLVMLIFKQALIIARVRYSLLKEGFHTTICGIFRKYQLGTYRHQFLNFSPLLKLHVSFNRRSPQCYQNCSQMGHSERHYFKRASFKRSSVQIGSTAAKHVGAAVLAHVGRSNRSYLDAA